MLQIIIQLSRDPVVMNLRGANLKKFKAQREVS